MEVRLAYLGFNEVAWRDFLRMNSVLSHIAFKNMQDSFPNEVLCSNLFNSLLTLEWFDYMRRN